MTVTRTLKVTGLLTLASVGLLFVPSASGDLPKVVGILGLVFVSPVFFVSALRHALRGLLWRVGSRLLVSYVLIGVVPIPFLLGFLYAAAMIFSGQLAGRRAESALKVHHRALVPTALDLVDELRAAGSPLERRQRFEAYAAERAAELPGLSYAWLAAGGAAEGKGPIPAEGLLPREFLRDGRASYLARSGKKVFLGSAVSRGDATLLVYLPLEKELRERLKEQTGIRVGFSTGTSSAAEPAAPREKGRGGVSITPPGEEVALVGLGEDGEAAAAAEPAPAGSKSPAAPAAAAGLLPALPEESGPLRGEWVHWFLFLDRPLVDWQTGDPTSSKLVLTVRTSIAREMQELFGSTRVGEGSESATSTVVLAVMKGLALTTVVVYLVASLLAVLLSSRIARATKRLSRGFEEIDRGNFAYRGKLKGRDQLASMVESFNTMAGHLQVSVSEKAAKEALDRELTVARDLQRRLLPPADFTFPGLEVSVDFRPAAAIGGDFYHFVVSGDRDLTVVIADVSGHGLPTGIVMAAAQASLSALAESGADTLALLTTLDREIRRTTDERTFVTLGHLRFRMGEGRLDYTNAGHLYPYRVEPSGRVTSLENPARPLGLGLPVTYRTVTAPLCPGDVWVLLSDGIVEASSPLEEEFGFARLEKLLASGTKTSAAALKDEILSEWRRFTGHDAPEDDRTLLVLRVLPPPPPSSSAPSGPPPPPLPTGAA